VKKRINNMSEHSLLKIFEFKTNDDYYWKEESGIKNFTIREIELNDERFLDLIAWNQLSYNDGDLKVKIKKTPGEKDDFFVRDIRDITIWRNLMIITWHHSGEKEDK
jgi:hypothetical protein